MARTRAEAPVVDVDAKAEQAAKRAAGSVVETFGKGVESLSPAVKSALEALQDLANDYGGKEPRERRKITVYGSWLTLTIGDGGFEDGVFGMSMHQEPKYRTVIEKPGKLFRRKQTKQVFDGFKTTGPGEAQLVVISVGDGGGTDRKGKVKGLFSVLRADKHGKPQMEPLIAGVGGLKNIKPLEVTFSRETRNGEVWGYIYDFGSGKVSIDDKKRADDAFYYAAENGTAGESLVVVRAGSDVVKVDGREPARMTISVAGVTSLEQLGLGVAEFKAKDEVKDSKFEVVVGRGVANKLEKLTLKQVARYLGVESIATKGYNLTVPLGSSADYIDSGLVKRIGAEFPGESLGEIFISQRDLEIKIKNKSSLTLADLDNDPINISMYLIYRGELGREDLERGKLGRKEVRKDGTVRLGDLRPDTKTMNALVLRLRKDIAKRAKQDKTTQNQAALRVIIEEFGRPGNAATVEMMAALADSISPLTEDEITRRLGNDVYGAFRDGADAVVVTGAPPMPKRREVNRTPRVSIQPQVSKADLQSEEPIGGQTAPQA